MKLNREHVYFSKLLLDIVNKTNVEITIAKSTDGYPRATVAPDSLVIHYGESHGVTSTALFDELDVAFAFTVIIGGSKSE